ncbi:hypothetical protein YT14_002370 [Salmonella enterica subsp. enterica serovar Oslo]|nr:hypothetical protein [Salmonella enterica subsp. enterica serovar Oslo]
MFDGRLPSINIGDNDSGFIGSADGVIDIYANSARVGYFDSAGLHMLRNIATTGTVNSGSGILTTNGDVYGPVWGNKWLSAWLSSQLAARDGNINTRATTAWVNQNFLSGFRLGTVESAQVWRAYGYADQPPYVITGVINSNRDDLIDSLTRRPLQMYINGWRNIAWL